ERPGRCYRAANVRFGRTLTALGLPGKAGRPAAGRELRKVRESASLELSPQAAGVDVDRGLAAAREAEDDVSAGGDDTRELVEEGDHVRVRHEVEGAVLEGQRRGVADLEPDAVGLPPRLGDHRVGEVDPDHLGLGEAARHRESGRARAGAEVERATRRRLDLLQRALEGGEVVGLDDLVPLGRDPVELPPERTAEEAPHAGPAYDRVRRQAREAAA